MPVSIKGSGGGSVTLDAGAAAADTTLTLPNTNGTVLVAPGGILPATAGGTGLSSPGTVGNVLTSTGSAWASTAPATPASGQIQSQLFVASGTWTAPTGVTQVRALVVGSGGGSAANAACGPSFAGAVGGLAYGIYTVVPGTGYTVTIGAAGAGGTGTANGASGGTVSFSTFASATGGGGSINNSSTPPTSGSGTGGTLRNSTPLSGSDTGAPYALGPFNGQQRYYSVGAGPALAFSVSSSYAAGAGGGGSGSLTGVGGIGGIVYLEWVG